MLSPDSYWHPGNMVYGDNPRKMGNSIVPNIYAIKQSSNLYVYALNNPLLWIDPSGYKIELSSKATKAEKQAYERAISYLQTSKTATAFIKPLMDSPEVFTIVFNNKLTDNYDPGTRTINWDPTGGLVLGDGKSIMSPAMALAHEMGHGAQLLAGVIESSKSYNQKQILAIEEANLASYETPIAKELGEYTRKNYGDAKMMYRVSNSTAWGHLKSNVVWYKPWTWFKSPTFVNQNSWKP